MNRGSNCDCKWERCCPSKRRWMSAIKNLGHYLLQARSWLSIPMRLLQVRLQWWHWKRFPTSGASLAAWRRLRLAALFCRLVSSIFLRPPCEVLFQLQRFIALSCQVSVGMSHRLNVSPSVSFQRKSGRPARLFPSASSPKSNCLGIRLSAMRATWPAHLSCILASVISMSMALALIRTSSLVTLCW